MCKELVVVDKGTALLKKSVAEVIAKNQPGAGAGTGGPASKVSTVISPPTTVGEETFSDILEAYISTQVDEL